MVNKNYKTSSVLPFSWTQTTMAFFHRYPNPYSSHVLTTDTISRFITPEGYLFTKRFITKINKLPSWARIFFKNRQNTKAYIIEESLIDTTNQIIWTHTSNIGLTNKVMSVTELNVYEPDPKNFSGATRIRKEIAIKSSLYGFRRAIEAFGLDKFKKCEVRSNLGFLWVLEKRFNAATTKEMNLAQSSDNVNVLEKCFNIYYNYNWTRLFARILAKIS